VTKRLPGERTVPRSPGRRPSAWRRRARRNAWPSVDTRCACARRRRRAPSSARCTGRSMQSAWPPGRSVWRSSQTAGSCSSSTSTALRTGSVAVGRPKSGARRALRGSGDRVVSLVPLGRRSERSGSRDRQRVPPGRRRADPERRRAEPPGAGGARRRPGPGARDESRSAEGARRPRARSGARRCRPRSTSRHQGRRLRCPARDVEGRDRCLRHPRGRRRPGGQAVRLEGNARRLRGLRERGAPGAHGDSERPAPRQRLPRAGRRRERSGRPGRGRRAG